MKAWGEVLKHWITAEECFQGEEFQRLKTSFPGLKQRSYKVSFQRREDNAIMSTDTPTRYMLKINYVFDCLPWITNICCENSSVVNLYLNIFSIVGKKKIVDLRKCLILKWNSFIRKETPWTVFSEFLQLHTEGVWEEYIFSVGSSIHTHVYPSASMPQKVME